MPEDCAGMRFGCGIRIRVPARVAFRPRAKHRVQDRSAGVQVHRVAELVALRRAAGLDAGRHLARVVAAEAALAERAQQIAERAVAEEVEALVGDLEAVLLGVAHAAAAAWPSRCSRSRSRSGGPRQVALRLQLLDDLLDQRVEPLLRVIGVAPVLAEHALERLLGEHPAVEDRLQDRVVQRLPGVPGRRRRRTADRRGCRSRSPSSMSDSFDSSSSRSSSSRSSPVNFE